MEGLKHTKGPWRYEKGDEDCGYEGRHFVAWEGTECDETTICEPRYGEHDARLIASAPDMVESLIAAFFGEVTASDDIRYKWQKIIEKATGMKIEEVLEATARQEAER